MAKYKYKCRRDLPLHNRDQFGLNALDRLQIMQSIRTMDRCMSIDMKLKLLCDRFETFPKSKLKKMRKLMKLMIIREYFFIKTLTEVQELPPVPRIKHERHTFDSFFNHLRNNNIQISEILRFQSVESLRRLKNGFLFPEGKITVETHKTTAEEIILISMETSRCLRLLLVLCMLACN